MENEKIIAKSSSNIKKSIRNIVLTLAIISGLIIIVTIIYAYEQDYKKGFDYIFSFIDGSTYTFLGGVLVLLFIPIILLIFKLLNEPELVVTDKRIYGITLTGKRVDLPISKVSAVGTGGFSRVSVSTSSGAISFSFIENQKELFEAISQLLIKKEEIKETLTVIENVSQTNSNADELKKYKELFDNGIITEEEFNTKKKQLLGL